MNITLSAAQAWKEANAAYVHNSAAEKAAFENVTAPILARLQDGDDVNFLHEIGKIVENTAGRKTARDMRLHHILGIAAQQGTSVAEEVEAQIKSITSQNKLPNVDVTGLYSTLFRRQQKFEHDTDQQRLCDEINQKLRDMSSPRRDLKR